MRAERYTVVEGKTLEITIEHARTLLRLADTGHLVSLRDRAVIAVLIYTAARIGAVAGLRRGSLTHDDSQWSLRFAEKNGKSRQIPLRHDLQIMLLGYLEAAGLMNAGKNAPLFPSAILAFRRPRYPDPMFGGYFLDSAEPCIFVDFSFKSLSARTLASALPERRYFRCPGDKIWLLSDVRG